MLLWVLLVMLGVFWCVLVRPGVVLVCFVCFCCGSGASGPPVPLVPVRVWTPGAVRAGAARRLLSWCLTL